MQHLNNTKDADSNGGSVNTAMVLLIVHVQWSHE